LLQSDTLNNVRQVIGRSRATWGLVFALIGVSSAQVAMPQLAAAADADALVKEGVALRRAGDDLAALKKFEQANGLEQSPRTVAQIGLAEQALGRWGAADRHLRAALAATGDAWIGKNRKSIQEALKIVEQHVGQLDIVGSPAGSEVRVDGELVGKLPLPRAVPATAGSVAVEVRAPGHLPTIRSAQVVVGGVARESFNLQPIAPAAPEPVGAGVPATRPGQPTGPSAAPPPTAVPAAEERPEERPSSSTEGDTGTGGMAPGHIAALVAGGLAVGALGLGIYEHVTWQNRVSTFQKDNTCDLYAANYGSPACRDLYNEGDDARKLRLVGYGLAGVFGATALVLYLVTPSPSTSASQGQVSLACTMNPATIGLSCGGRF
jgi:hypothetical protein